METVCYEIQIKGQLPPYREPWFEGADIQYDEQGNTILHGPVEDQAMLFGILDKIRDMGLVLISVRQSAIP